MTRSLWKYVPAWLLAAVLWGLAAGCGMVYDDYPEDYDPTDPLVLVLRVAPVAQSRVDDGKERMETLRIVLLDKDGNVEYNEMFGSSGSLGSSGGDAGLTAEEGFSEDGGSFFKLIPTTPGDKKIFLIANEASVESVNGDDNASLTALLAEFPKGSPRFEDMVNGIWFAPTYDGKIPLTSSYAFTLTQSSGRAPMDFYLVHAATKFEFTFENYLENPLRIDELSLSSLSDRMFLMAQFEDASDPTKKTVTWSDGTTQKNAYWIDWLKAVSDETNLNPDDPENERVNEKYGWLWDYAMPQGTNHTIRHIVSAGDATGKPGPIGIGGSDTLPVVYWPESKNPSSDAGQEQEYSFTVTLVKTGSDGTTERKTFTRSLSNVNITTGDVADKGTPQNLRALFRNTHVKVTARVTQTSKDIELTLRIGVCRWYEEEIDIPTFD